MENAAAFIGRKKVPPAHTLRTCGESPEGCLELCGCWHILRGCVEHFLATTVLYLVTIGNMTCSDIYSIASGQRMRNLDPAAGGDDDNQHENV